MATDKIIDIEAINEKFDSHIAKQFPVPSNDDIIKYKPMIDELLQDVQFIKLKRKYSYSHKNSFLYNIFLIIYHSNKNKYTNDDHIYIKNKLRIKPGKSHSGIISITIFTSPEPSYINKDGVQVVQKFSCAFNCSYCPNEPGQPRSYLKGEPGVLRANREEFDCVKQMHIRMEALYLTGHEIDKLEVLVLGGTWTSYPVEYRTEYIRDMYYAANTFTDYIKSTVLKCGILRERQSLQYEKKYNKESSECKVIGLTLETRPDTINAEELIRFRAYGCTRIQLGIQHLADDVLDKINRKCPTQTTIKAIEMLKNCGYKIDAHFMPNLPFSSVKKDEAMFDDLLGVLSKKYDGDMMEYEKWILKCPEYQVDQWKIYPTTITPYTEIKKWYDEGSYIPYSNEELYNLIYKVKLLIFPWIRLNRCIRDICADYVPQIDYNPNMREMIQNEMERSGLYCQCIRCREVKGRKYNESNAIIIIREYNASNGKEYFISCETIDKKILYGFVRLRISNSASIFPELRDCALIRELHVYSEMIPVNEMGAQAAQSAQHRGIGKKLMAKAESIAIKNGIYKISVISGQGVKGYYEKLGYFNNEGDGDFMMKHLLSIC